MTHKQFELKREAFADRHIGPGEKETKEMLNALGESSLDAFCAKVVPASLAQRVPAKAGSFSEPTSEFELLGKLKQMASHNQIFRSFIGLGYYNCITPPVIQRNILENPGWYTQYTPYQAEISQGRLEALFNYQTMIADMTALPIANASLLDEATAAAEAMFMSFSLCSDEKKNVFLVAADSHPQTIAVLRTRAEALGIKIEIQDSSKLAVSPEMFGCLVQYPSSKGDILDFAKLADKLHQQSALLVVACDLLALTVLKAPGEFGADVAIGSAQRFGVPLGYGGPHAAFFATKDEYKRSIPGRIIGLSKDAAGRPGYRLALQTREQHIRREKATSNICTAQVLLAIMASMYAVYHGPAGLKKIARRVNALAGLLAVGLKEAGFDLSNKNFFDTLCINVGAQKPDAILNRARELQINLQQVDAKHISCALDETCSERDVGDLLYVFSGKRDAVQLDKLQISSTFSESFKRQSEFLQHEVFARYHSETEFLRYLRRLEARDLSLGTAMIPLGSCTMKLNATTEMLPVTWPEFGALHPFAPREQAGGYSMLFFELEQALVDITGFSAVSLQPNAGSQGEYAGLLVIRAFHKAAGQGQRTICLIPRSAHGTNPASAAMAGLKVVVVDCDASGNVDLQDLARKAEEHKANLACLMVTYPSTHGVFEEGISEACKIVHQNGGQVYMDGANLNALVGLVRPGDIGADVCHINLHKTFCIPHGGGGPGMGPIAVGKHLAPFLPSHPLVALGHEQGVGPVSAAPWGSASILPISWSYMALMGAQDLKRATQMAILNANYVAKKLSPYFPVLYRGSNGYVAHECILDFREIKKRAGVEVEDVAKRLMDYGFHAPTVSFPVAGTIMVEPTESESKAELDRFCAAMIAIHGEIEQIAQGRMDAQNNPLKNAPHTALDVTASEWSRPYSREVAAFPAPWSKDFKFWPAVGRIDAAYGDKNLICSCPEISSY